MFSQIRRVEKCAFPTCFAQQTSTPGVDVADRHAAPSQSRVGSAFPVVEASFVLKDPAKGAPGSANLRAEASPVPGAGRGWGWLYATRPLEV